MFSHRRSVLGARSARSIAVAALVVPLLVVGTAATGQTSRKTSASSVTSALLAAASHKSGVSVSELKVGDQFRQPFAFTGQTIDVAKVVAAKTGKTYLVALDSQGRSVDYYAEQAADTAARERTHGKLDPALSATLNSVSASKAVPVSIWLKTGELPRGRRAGERAQRREQTGPVHQRRGREQRRRPLAGACGVEGIGWLRLTGVCRHPERDVEIVVAPHHAFGHPRRPAGVQEDEVVAVGRAR